MITEAHVLPNLLDVKQSKALEATEDEIRLLPGKPPPDANNNPLNSLWRAPTQKAVDPS